MEYIESEQKRKEEYEKKKSNYEIDSLLPKIYADMNVENLIDILGSKFEVGTEEAFIGYGEYYNLTSYYWHDINDMHIAVYFTQNGIMYKFKISK